MTDLARPLTRRRERAIRQFQACISDLLPRDAPECSSRLIDRVALQAEDATPGSDLWEDIAPECQRALSAFPIRRGTIAHLVEWEALKLESRLEDMQAAQKPTTVVPLFRNGHVHIATLIHVWRRLSLETEEWLSDQGYDTLFDVGPWGGFNYVLEPDGYTCMPFARLTLAMGSLPITPLEEQGGAFFAHFMPRYRDALYAAGVAFADVWQYQFPQRDQAGRLLELSCSHYLPHHTYERRTYIKVRLSRACETVEELMLQYFLVLLERLHFTNDWALYREQTKDVDARFDLQDFISLNHLVEGIYQRSAAEDRLLSEIKLAFRGSIRTSTILYRYFDSVVRSGWIENLYWALAETALGVKRYQRFVSFDREVCHQIPPRMLIPVRRYLRQYHKCLGAYSPLSDFLVHRQSLTASNVPTL